MLRIETFPASLGGLWRAFRQLFPPPQLRSFAARVWGPGPPPGAGGGGGVLLGRGPPGARAPRGRRVFVPGARRGRKVGGRGDAGGAGGEGPGGAPLGAARQGGLPAAGSLASGLRTSAALKSIAAPVPGAGGGPRRIGARLGTPADLATTATW